MTVFLRTLFRRYSDFVASCKELSKDARMLEKRKVHTIDLRSDTVTQPTAAMRRAMADAVVGDDVFGEDPTVVELQERTALLLGKESSLFVPSGTMANLIAVFVHCNERSSEILLGDRSHLHISEQGCIAQIASVHHRTLSNKPDGTWDLEEMEEKFREERLQNPITKLVCVENTHCLCGGRVTPMAWINKVLVPTIEVTSFCKNAGIVSHLDGARICNAATRLNVPASDIARNFDSVSMCLSKNLGAPVGSVLAGRREFIKKAARTRKVLGGGMRQAGVLAAAGLVALDMKDRLHEDHDHATLIAKGDIERRLMNE